MKNSSGPAFPWIAKNTGEKNILVHGVVIPPGSELAFAGMTLRQYYAGQALAGLSNSPTASERRREIARQCHELADAMLAAEEATDGQA